MVSCPIPRSAWLGFHSCGTSAGPLAPDLVRVELFTSISVRGKATAACSGLACLPARWSSCDVTSRYALCLRVPVPRAPVVVSACLCMLVGLQRVPGAVTLAANSGRGDTCRLVHHVVPVRCDWRAAPLCAAPLYIGAVCMCACMQRCARATSSRRLLQQGAITPHKVTMTPRCVVGVPRPCVLLPSMLCAIVRSGVQDTPLLAMRRPLQAGAIVVQVPLSSGTLCGSGS